jgi:hypothetical protein
MDFEKQETIAKGIMFFALLAAIVGIAVLW